MNTQNGLILDSEESVLAEIEKSVRFENARAQAGFTQISNALLRDASLSVNARFLWALLASYAWQDESCFPGQEGLGEVMLLTERSVRTYVGELEGAGLVRVVRRGLGKSNVYVLLAMSGRGLPAGPEADCRSDRKLASGEEDSVKKTQRKKTSPPKKSSSSKPVLEPHEEPVGFGSWLVKHVDECARYEISRSAPRAGTSYRSELARSVAGLLGEGVTLEELELASIGVLADKWMRENGHTKFENVLRKTKLGGKVDAGRAELKRRGEDPFAKFKDGDPRA